MSACAHCGAENPVSHKFCGNCGSALSLACSACGELNAPGQRFCGNCGAPLQGGTAPAAATTPVPVAPTAERRLVSVLFADLVGFTALSESRDSEEVRELLSRYFDTCSRLIALYGGTVEKFIGDAVMAVWGTPTATEDDPERAVRAALDLVTAVSALGDEVGAPELRARAGVLTGEAAVTIGAEGQGMVAGDLVNTASRIQSAAEPGTVLVGEATRRTTDQTVVYEAAGAHELKGKEGLVPLWRALRVVSGARGSLKSQGLEAPFVGRDRELRRIKDLFHECAEGKKAHLVSVTGIAGIGKSRLAWEFYKYFDGLPQLTYWHRGRCLAYGEGVTYWALADMVRMRCRISEDDEPAAALEKLRAAVEEHIADPEERVFVEPRIAHLLGLADFQAQDKHDLFAAWRLFFERLADVYPTVLAFEDLQWADESLLDFVEYLLEWSRNSPLYVITLARPELAERRPTWGAGQRAFTSLFLEPLTDDAMEQMLAGLVPGLPDATRRQILARAQGVPLYAVETVRMLLDRGVLVLEGAAYRLTGEVGALEVPETLHALIAARLDGLPPAERLLLQDGAVLGKTFTTDALAALAGSDEGLEPLLNSLVRKEVLAVQADPRSPEHGQYGFLQDLVRHVAYETVAKRDRRPKHLAAAAHLSTIFGADDDEFVEVIASHYLAARAAVPEADDAEEITSKARAMLVRAGDRAASLAAAAEARRYFNQAAELTGDTAERAEMLLRSGQMAARAGDPDGARSTFEASIELFEQVGDTHAAARVAIPLARLERFTGRIEEAVARLERAFEAISADGHSEELALIAARVALLHWFTGNLDAASERAEFALELADAHGYKLAAATAIGAKGAIAHSRGRSSEELAFWKESLAIALEHGFVEEANTAYFILSDLSFHRDRYADALAYLHEASELARTRGDRPGEWSVLAESTYALAQTGRWDEALEISEQLTAEQASSGGMFLSLLSGPLEIHLQRGNLAEAKRLYGLLPALEGSADMQEIAAYFGATAALALAEGRLAEALEAGRRAIEPHPTLALSHQCVEQGFVEALEASTALGDSTTANALLKMIQELPPGRRPPYLDAQCHRFNALLNGDLAELDLATDRFRELGMPFWVAVSRLQHAEQLGAGKEAERLLAEARETFEQLRATPWLARVARLTATGRDRQPVPARARTD